MFFEISSKRFYTSLMQDPIVGYTNKYKCLTPHHPRWPKLSTPDWKNASHVALQQEIVSRFDDLD